MVRRKARATRRSFALPQLRLDIEAPVRPVRARSGPKIEVPRYRHASTAPDKIFQGKVAAVFEVPVPPDTEQVALPSTYDPDEFTEAYRTAFGICLTGLRKECPGNSHCDVAVFVKDWDAGTEMSSIGIRRANETRIAKFLEYRDIAINDYLLTIAIVPRGGPFRRFDLNMQGGSIPAVVVKMVQVGILRLFYVPERDAVQFVVSMRDGDLCGGGKIVPFLRSRFFAWMYNYKIAAGAVVEKRIRYDKEWVFEVVRRRTTDHDVAEYIPFLERVRQNCDLDVTLRPYQERAVAWMLSRELGHRLDITTDVLWHDAKHLSRTCPLNSCLAVSVEPLVKVDVANGGIEAGKGAAADALKHASNGFTTPDQVKLPAGEQALTDSSPDEILQEGAGRGGLLCDEMGLGKTVELMQLVLCNKLEEAVNGENEEIVVPNSTQEVQVCFACEREIGYRASSKTRSCLECERVIHKECLRYQRGQANKEGYVCSNCRDSIERLLRADTPLSELPKSKATVVVIPTPLLLQWKNEIKKHVKDALKVEIYQGHSQSGYMALKRLMKADVVLATYDALRDDVHTFNALRNPRRGLRRAKVFRPTPLPLLTVRWHRLAWDESQMLGARGVSQAARLARYLHATYRWCITGTPMVHSLHDALPMFDILRIRCGQHLMHWSSFFKPSILAEDERRLKLALRNVMWRTSKEDVDAEELQLPPQVTEVVHIPFGPVERYHYSSLQQSVRTATLRFSTVQDYRSRTVSSDLLTMLRQACCHPQIGISGRRLMCRAAVQALYSLGSQQRSQREDAASQAVKRAESPLDMNEVLHALVAKANADCAEALRSLVASHNGLAAICWLQHSLLRPTSTEVQGLVTAVNLYRETLSLAEENKNVVHMDSIQRMHILFNLNEALDSVTSTQKRISNISDSDLGKQEAIMNLNSLGRTLRDANLLQEVDELQRAYVAEARAQLVSSEASYKELAHELGRKPLVSHAENASEDEYLSDSEDFVEREMIGAFGRNRGTEPLQWWHKAAAVVLEKEEKKQTQFLNRVIQKLLDAIPGGGMNVRTLAHRISSIHSFGLVLQPELMKLQHARNKLREALLLMPGSVEPTQAQVAESGQCRECREFGTGPACSHCRAEKLFKEVERRLYALRETDETADFVLDNSPQRREALPSASCAPANPKRMFDSALMPKGRVSVFAQNAGGLRFQSEIETILKSLASAAREVKETRFTKEVSDWFDRLEAVKKEHTEARVLFEAQRSLLARMDEVNMALMRFSVLAPDEDFSSLSEDQQRHRLPRESLESLNVQFTNEKAMAESDFRNKRGNLVYLRSLAGGEDRCDNKDARASGSGPKREPCAVCLAEFDDSVSKVAVFVCGHVLCCDCTLRMIKGADVKSRVSNVRCPTCRTKCPVQEINFTTNGPTKPGSSSKQQENGKIEGQCETDKEIEMEAEGGPENAVSRKRRGRTSEESPRKKRRVIEHKSTYYDPGAAVIGLIGAKASAVIRTLRGIWQDSRSAKVLIFSEWSEVLGLLSRALEMNQISHSNGAVAPSAMKFAEMVDEFKFSASQHVLLLPLKRAGAGLNVIEATHVILIEPSMNVSLESQGVGRVHRIGQERKTFVHRIIMRDTIEETVLRLGDVYRGRTGLISEHTVNLQEVMGAIHSERDIDREAIVVSSAEEG